MVMDIPKTKVTQNFFDYVEFLDKTDDTHRALALGTNQRVHLIDFLARSEALALKTGTDNVTGKIAETGLVFRHEPRSHVKSTVF